MKISKNCLVEIEYELRNPQGEAVEASEEDGPLVYLHGHGLMLPGLERALENRSAGEELDLTLEPEDAFGDHDPEGLFSVPRADLPADAEIVPGDLLPIELEDEDGNAIDSLDMRVVAISPDAVDLDANHPLAGVQVGCSLKVLSVREATKEEVAEHLAAADGEHDCSDH